MFKIFSEVRELKLEVANLKKKLSAADAKNTKPVEKNSVDLAKEKAAEVDKLKKKKEEIETLEKLEKEKLEKTPIVNPETNIYAVNTRINEINSRLDKVVTYIKVNMKKQLDEKLIDINSRLDGNKTEVLDILQRIEVTLTNKIISLFEEVNVNVENKVGDSNPTSQQSITEEVVSTLVDKLENTGSKLEKLGMEHISLYNIHNVKINEVKKDVNKLQGETSSLQESIESSDAKLDLVLTKLTSFEGSQKELSSLLERFVGYFENLYKSKTSV